MLPALVLLKTVKSYLECQVKRFFILHYHDDASEGACIFNLINMVIKDHVLGGFFRLFGTLEGAQTNVCTKLVTTWCRLLSMCLYVYRITVGCSSADVCAQCSRCAVVES